jgi:hypothetical protein
MTFNARLDAVSKAKAAYVVAKTTLEARLREQMRAELSNLQTQIDIAVRYAVDSGERKAAVMRALGTKDYNTLKQSLERTQGVAEVVGTNPLDSVYFHSVDDDGVEVLEVRYDRHGTLEYSGYASFTIKRLDNGSLLFLSRTPLWNEDYTKRNDVVVALDGKTDGEYYVEAVDWITQS